MFAFRYAVSVLWVLDADYNVLTTWFGRTVIRSSYKLFYEVKSAGWETSLFTNIVFVIQICDE